MDDSIDLELSLTADQRLRLEVKGTSEFTLYPNPTYDTNFVAVRVEIRRAGSGSGPLMGTLNWSEQWHQRGTAGWQRAIVFTNASADSVIFDATFRTLP